MHFACGKINDTLRFNAATRRFNIAREGNDRHIMGISMTRIASARLQFGHVDMELG